MGARKFLTPIDLTQLELQNAVVQVLGSDPGSPVQGQIWFNSVSKTFKFYSGTATIVLGTLDQITAAAANVDLNSHKIVNLTDGSSAQDAATYGQLQASVAGVSWKATVRAATTVAGTLATSFENGDVIDGVTLATGDRILIKDQAAGEFNGIYVVAASGAPARATDADSAAEVLQAAVWVQEGTVNGDTAWVNTTNAPITLNTTGLVFTQFNGIAALTAGAGLTKTGNTVDAVAASSFGTGGPGGGLVVAANDIAVDKDVVVRKFSVDVGDNSSTSITVTHNLGTKDVTAQVYDLSTPFAQVECDVRHATTNTLTLVFAVAPTTAQYRCVVHG